MNLDLLDPTLAAKIAGIVEAHMGAAIGVMYGKDLVSDDAWKLALGLGLVDDQSSDNEIGQQMHRFGVYMAHVHEAGGDPDRYGTTADEFLAAVQADAVPTSRVEYGAQDYVRRRAAHHCRGLGNRINHRTGQVMVEADAALRADMQATIRDAMGAKFGDRAAQDRMRQRGIADGKPADFYDDASRATIGRITSDLKHATQDWSRDWRRIVQTEAQDAMQQGKVDAWETQEADRSRSTGQAPREPIVYKLPRPGACPHCLRLHLDGGYPRLFTMSHLTGNGSNVGRKTAEWQATISPVHPWCSCELLRLPPYADLPSSWKSGLSAPSVVGSDGALIFPE